jgi:hypothetical protein
MTYIYEKIAEIITGESKVQVGSASTQWGLDNETDAIKWFTQITGKQVVHYGVDNYSFFEYGNVGGCSPDGICIDECANVQIKCPYNSANHLQYLLVKGGQAERQEWVKNNESEYYIQCQFEMMCCKTDKCYLAIYDPRTLEPEHRMAIFELEKDEEIRKELDMRLEAASEIVRNAIEYLGTLNINNLKP